jgi:thioesterase domain-containing protein/aryl carrier-like protein
VGELLDASQLRREVMPPRTPTELKLARIWEELLDVRPIGLRDNFFELGGHSLLAVRLRARIKARLGQDLPLAALFEEPTVEHLARRLDAASGEPAWSPLVPLRPDGQKTPFFCVHPIGGGVLGYRELAQHLGPDQPFYGLQAPGLDVQAGAPHISIEEMASSYLSEIRGVQPSGPYRLGGWSFGGVIAFEMAQQLRSRGEEVEILSLFDTPVPPGSAGGKEVDLAAAATILAREQARQQGKQLELTVEDLRDLSLEEKLERILEGLRELGVVGLEIDVPLFLQFLQGFQARLDAVERYQARPYPGRVHLFRPLELDPESLRVATAERLRVLEDPALGWGKIAEAGVEVYKVPGYHDTMLSEPYVRDLAQRLDTCISQQLGASPVPDVL